MKKIKIGARYRHVESNKIVVTRSEIKIKLYSAWFDGVTYVCGTELYARDLESFNFHFLELAEVT